MKRKCMMSAALMSFMLVITTGCGGRESENAPSMPPGAEQVEEDAKILETGNEIPDTTAEENNTSTENNASMENNASTENAAPSADSSSGHTSPFSRDSTIIGGKVRSVSQDSFVISRTLYDDSDSSFVIIPEAGSPDEVLVTVRCTESTAFEYWTIQGGGAGIDMQESSFLAIQVDGGLEAEGYFDGEEFIAQKVIIEVYQ